jgi:hypothetical protein
MALNIEIARLDTPSRRQFGQVHDNFTLKWAPKMSPTGENRP